jgi:hypothetical protein
MLGIKYWSSQTTLWLWMKLGVMFSVLQSMIYMFVGSYAPIGTLTLYIRAQMITFLHFLKWITFLHFLKCTVSVKVVGVFVVYAVWKLKLFFF